MKISLSPETIFYGVLAAAGVYIASRIISNITDNPTVANVTDAVQNAGANLGALFMSESQAQAQINKDRGLPSSGLLTPAFQHEVDAAGGFDAYIKAHGGKVITTNPGVTSNPWKTTDWTLLEWLKSY